MAAPRDAPPSAGGGTLSRHWLSAGVVLAVVALYLIYITSVPILQHSRAPTSAGQANPAAAAAALGGNSPAASGEWNHPFRVAPSSSSRSSTERAKGASGAGIGADLAGVNVEELLEYFGANRVEDDMAAVNRLLEEGPEDEEPLLDAFAESSMPRLRNGQVRLAFLLLFPGSFPQTNNTRDQFTRMWRRFFTKEDYFALHFPTESTSQETWNALWGNTTDIPNAIAMGGMCLARDGPGLMRAIAVSTLTLLMMGDWTHLVILPGDAYPVRPRWYIDQLLRSNPGTNFLGPLHFSPVREPPTSLYAKWRSQRESATGAGRLLFSAYDDCWDKNVARHNDRWAVIGPEVSKFTGVRELKQLEGQNISRLYEGDPLGAVLTREAAKAFSFYRGLEVMPFFRDAAHADRYMIHSLVVEAATAEATAKESTDAARAAAIVRNISSLSTLITPRGPEVCGGGDKGEPCALDLQRAKRLLGAAAAPSAALAGQPAALFSRGFFWPNAEAAYDWVDEELLQQAAPADLPDLKLAPTCRLEPASGSELKESLTTAALACE